MSTIQVGDEKIYYIERGAGLPVVLIHGAGSSHLIWGAQVSALSKISRAVTLDLPGHGKSQDAGRDSIEAYRDLLIAFLDTLGLERVIVIGHSMGGAIAQTIALSHPDRIAALGLVSTGARLRVLPALLDGVLNDFEKTVRAVTEYSFAPGADQVLMQQSETQFRACDPNVLYGDYTACNVFDVIGRVMEIRAPTLIVCGRQDQMTPPKYSEFLANKIPIAHLEWIDHAGHQVMIEQPEALNHALVEFVRGLTAKPSPMRSRKTERNGVG